MNKNKKNNQGIVAIIGILSVIIIISITVYKAGNFGSKNKDASEKLTEIKLEYQSITGPQLKDRMIKNDIQIIDTRSLPEFEIEHIIDSYNIPLNELEGSDAIDNTKDVVLIGSSSEEENLRAITLLQKRLQKKIFILQGGFVDWKAIGGTTVAWGDLSSFADQAKVTFITISDLEKYIESKMPILLIDARKNLQYAEGHIYGAVNIPVSEIEKRRKEIKSTKEIIFYSDNELEAFQAATKLFDMKLIKANVLRGGLDEWKSKGYALVK